VLKQRVQAGSHNSAWEALQHLLRTEGALGLFAQGKLSSQILRDVPYAIVTLVSYEMLQSLVVRIAIAQQQQRLQNSQNAASDSDITGSISSADGVVAVAVDVGDKKLTDALCGAIAGGLGSFVTNPMDVVKTRMMTSRQYASVWDASVRIFQVSEILH
jgi:solute carrier family 25 S-adenosylmethionine transporter 26